MQFTTKLNTQSDRLGGFGASGPIDPDSWADELFKAEIHGPFLCCYMLRRFGWPNAGSDPYKNLCSWNLTTPITGLYLHVTPYMGHSGPDSKHVQNMHFGIRHNKELGEKMSRDPGRERYWKRRERAVMRWWKTKGIKLYAFGVGLKEGDRDELVHEYSADTKNDKRVWGLWRRTASVKHKCDIPKQAQMVAWWLGEFIKAKHPMVKLPKMSKWERNTRETGYHRKVKAAVVATLTDLLRPTSVRDISFTPFGDIERTPEAVKRYKNQPEAGYFNGAGHTPEYWFKHATKKERQGKSD